MKKSLLLLFLIITPTTLLAKQWYCEEVASEKDGNTFNSCGIGSGKTEEEARANSFKNAKKEFNFFCESSTSCKNRERDVTPGRTDCEYREKFQNYICKRLIIIKVGKEIDSKKELKERTSDSEIKEKEAELNDLREELIKIKKIERIKKEIAQKKKAINAIKKGKETEEEESKIDDTSSSEIKQKEKELEIIRKDLDKLRNLERLKEEIEKKKRNIKLIKEGKEPVEDEESDYKPYKHSINEGYFSNFKLFLDLNLVWPTVAMGISSDINAYPLGSGYGAYLLIIKNNRYYQFLGLGYQGYWQLGSEGESSFYYLNFQIDKFEFSYDIGSYSQVLDGKNTEIERSFRGYGIRYAFREPFKTWAPFLSYRKRFLEDKTTYAYLVFGFMTTR